jgi:PAT family beta-lactamase induction signal transducer AmpG
VLSIGAIARHLYTVAHAQAIILCSRGLLSARRAKIRIRSGAGHRKPMVTNAPDRKPGGWWQAVLVYRQPRVLIMLFLGFSAGLPFYLIFQTLSAWLRQEGIQRSTIGMMAWVGLMYSIKVLWSPIVDRVKLPFLFNLLGRRRSWMLVAQVGIAVCLLNISTSQPSLDLAHVAWGALFLAFCAATQDIAIDAWRIESAAIGMQGAMAAAYQMGYRAALIAGGAGALGIAGEYGWATSYTTMALLACVGIATTFIAPEPAVVTSAETIKREARVDEWLARNGHLPKWMRDFGGQFIGAVVCPLQDFFSRFPFAVGIVIVLFVCSYRLTDFTMGPMANPFYIDQGYTLTEIGTVVKAIGLPVGMVGVVIGGLLIARFGVLRVLFIGSVLIMCSNIGFALLAKFGTPTLIGLGLVNALDNIALGIHGTVLIAFLSGLTNPRYTATQYALFTSFYALPGKVLEGFSGFVAEHLGYFGFFLYTASLSIPALILLTWLIKRNAVVTFVEPTVSSPAPAPTRGT